MWILYDQNNSGGRFVRNENLNAYVLIEGETFEQIEAKAEEIGIYYDGVAAGRDCPCCGDRWYRATEHDMMEVPKVYNKIIEPEHNERECRLDLFNVTCHMADGNKSYVGYDGWPADFRID